MPPSLAEAYDLVCRCVDEIQAHLGPSARITVIVRSDRPSFVATSDDVSTALEALQTWKAARND